MTVILIGTHRGLPGVAVRHRQQGMPHGKIGTPHYSLQYLVFTTLLKLLLEHTIPPTAMQYQKVTQNTALPAIVLFENGILNNFL